MKFKEFIGIDVSKSHIDVFIRSNGFHSKFDNNENGFKAMIEWIWQYINCTVEEVVFALEHTGLYSLNLSLFLDEGQYNYTIIPGLELKRSLGIARGKSDKADARSIAEYIYEKKEKIKLYQMPSETVLKLKKLLSYRERMVKEKAAYEGRLKEYKDFLSQEGIKVLFESHARMISYFKEEIKIIEKELHKVIKEDKKLTQQFNLINSIKGIGPQTAFTLIVITNGFTLFKNWRKFASYAGTAPFPNRSGTFVGRTKTNHLANKRVKALLTNCASSSIQFNPEMRMYYQRRVAEGKNEMSTINIIRNKLLARIFAVVQRETPYVETYGYAT